MFLDICLTIFNFEHIVDLIFMSFMTSQDDLVILVLPPCRQPQKFI